MSENRKPICLARMSGEGLEEKYVKEVVALSAGTAAVHLALYGVLSFNGNKMMIYCGVH